MSTSNLRRGPPIIAVVGATGTGKSDLAVELALRFNGEIINGDAMQLYEGLPIITNKMTMEERKGVPHHLLGCIRLDKPTCTVGQFVTTALECIKEIRSRGRLPILVGGTHYYTQALLFKDHIIEKDEQKETGSGHPILKEPTEVILTSLREVDPIMADRWHPNDRRKIQRSLEIWLTTGKRASDTYVERLAEESNPSSARNDSEDAANRNTLRFSTLLLWVHSSKQSLTSRLDARVIKMVESGLLNEVENMNVFQAHQASLGTPVDRTRGIWVSIGYKEFEAYQLMLQSAAKSEAELAKLKEFAIEQTQAATRQYAKRQVRWIRIKLLNALSRADAMNTTFLLDGSDISTWNEMVKDAGLALTEKFLRNEVLPDPLQISEVAKEMLEVKCEDLSQRPDLWVKRTCDACGITAATPAMWDMHIKSRGHRRATSTKAPRDYSQYKNVKQEPSSGPDQG
ncbi:tRNA isopentenyltransferas-like protein [Tothia fuscella]|uniref:tRNA dimethylallyltransferase n=1 Tax=Tothia fuscella TaxID=1048955 RepID=A0A9P4NT95_9PEZI|nr:tRNA isopentenyltransferas-like protein [Tothia fuscella]